MRECFGTVFGTNSLFLCWTCTEYSSSTAPLLLLVAAELVRFHRCSTNYTPPRPQHVACDVVIHPTGL